MIAYINVFTQGIGYSHWEVDLGFTVLPKYEIKKRLTKTMNTWFTKNKHGYPPKCKNVLLSLVHQTQRNLG